VEAAVERLEGGFVAVELVGALHGDIGGFEELNLLGFVVAE
jgi:hypothetical protein